MPLHGSKDSQRRDMEMVTMIEADRHDSFADSYSGDWR
jgi:hypothetical protein